MDTLNLNKIQRGHYQVSSNGIYIDIVCPFSLNYGMIPEASKEWQLTIVVGDETVHDFWYPTKREAVEEGTKWVIDNLTGE